MSLRVVRREEQLTAMTQQSFIGESLRPTVAHARWADSVFDGDAVARDVLPRFWRLEARVHETLVLSDRVSSTRYFHGPQSTIVRDDIRRRSWGAFADSRGLLLTDLSTQPYNLRQLTSNPVWRYHVALNKHDGSTTVAWVEGAAGSRTLRVNSEVIATAAQDVDFPFLDFAQAPVGNTQPAAPPFALLTYKDRESQRVFVRRIENGAVQDERELQLGAALGGLPFAISGDTVLARVDLIENDAVVPALIISNDQGRTFSDPARIDLAEYQGGQVLPSATGPVTDHLGNFHVPLALRLGDEVIALNYVLNEALVEAVRVPGRDLGVVLTRFPKATGGGARFGNGITDGLGLIMVAHSGGNLFASNSQSGGISFPPPVELNNEMLYISAFGATQCYTRGDRANTVSMDYMWLEGDASANPVSQTLHVETWDMPLPEPVVRADVARRDRGAMIDIRIERDAHFYPGQTTFTLSDPNLRIEDVSFEDSRRATLRVSGGDPRGTTVAFEAKTLFYHHAGQATVN